MQPIASPLRLKGPNEPSAPVAAAVAVAVAAERRRQPHGYRQGLVRTFRLMRAPRARIARAVIGLSILGVGIGLIGGTAGLVLGMIGLLPPFGPAV